MGNYNRFIATDVNKIMAQGKLKIERRASELSIRLNFYCAYHQVLIMRVTAIYLFVIAAFYFSSEVKEAYGSVRTALIVASVLSSIDLVRILYGVVNRSYITLTPSELRLRFGPLPMCGGLKIPSREIEQFTVTDRHLSYQTKSGGSVQSTYYVLSLIDKQGKAHPLISTKYATGEVFSLNHIAKEMASFLQVPCKLLPAKE
jgi:hypothetical protein